MKIFKYISTFLLTGTLLLAQAVVTKTLARENSKDSLTPSRKDAIALMRGVCGKGNINSSNPESCKSCPSFIGNGGNGSGTLTSVIYGSFTKSGSTEAFVDLEGCQAHAGNWGGSVLLSRASRGWSVMRYEAGLRSDSCLKFKARNGRNSLVCKGSHLGQGYLWSSLDAIEVGSTKTTTTNLLTVGSNTGTCKPPYYEVQIEDFLSQDANKDSQDDLVIKVSEAKETQNITRSDDQLCEARLPKPSFHQLTFLFNGQSFRPTPTTANLMKRLEVK